VESSARLKWMQLGSVGFDDLLTWDWKTLGSRIQATNLSGFFANPVAETALAGLLAVMRGIDRLGRLQQAAKWDKMSLRPTLRSLQNAQVFLAGYGSIAQRFERLLSPFDCRFTRFSRSQKVADERSALASSDVIFCSMPETPDTSKWFNRERLSWMNRDAIFINVGRGGVVDEAALIERLKQHDQFAAVLDVTAVEPLPVESPLWQLPNVLLTQHTAGGTTDEMKDMIKFFLANLKRFRQAEPLQGVIHWSQGY